jgi:hypothetical protein
MLRIAVASLVLGSACRAPDPRPSPGEPTMTSEPPLSITARCKAHGCEADEDDVWVDVTVTNRSAAIVEVPLAYLGKTGPAIRLVNARSGAGAHLRTNLADPALRADLTELAPGAAASFPWVITRGEVEQLGPPTDITAEITIATELRVAGAPVAFTGTTTLRLAGP